MGSVRPLKNGNKVSRALGLGACLAMQEPTVFEVVPSYQSVLASYVVGFVVAGLQVLSKGFKLFVIENSGYLAHGSLKKYAANPGSRSQSPDCLRLPRIINLSNVGALIHRIGFWAPL